MTGLPPSLEGRPLRLWVGAFVLLASLLVLQYSFLLSGHGFHNHDSPGVYLRIQQYASEFASGRLPQSFPDVASGGGAAFPRFYPPLAYYVSAAIYALTDDLIWAGHLSALLSVLLSGLAMAWALKTFAVHPMIGALAGFAYAAMPYRLTVVAVRGALAESWAMVWLPLLLVGCWRITGGERRGWSLFSVALAALLLTHTAIALWAVPVLTLVVIAAAGRARLRRSLPVLGGSLVGAALAAWYLVPMWWYLPTVWASDPITMWATAAEFSSWSVSWGVLFGNGLFRFDPDWPMRLSHGTWGLIVPFSMALLRRQSVNPGVTAARRLGLACGVSWLLLVMAILAPRMIAPVLPDALLYLQFPYRLIGLAGFFGGTGLALIVTSMGDGVARRTILALWTVTVGVTALVESAVPRPPRPYHHQGLLASVADQPSGLTVRYEYFPRTTNPVTLAARVRVATAKLESAADSVVRGPGTTTIAIRLTADTTITLPFVAFDFIRLLSADGSTLPATADDGLVAVSLPAGLHSIAVTRRVPWPYWVGAGVTLIGLLVLLMGEAARRTGRPRGY